MAKTIVIINGTGGSGKDTFVEFAGKYAPVLNFSSVDKVKEIARLIGWDGGKTEKDRKFLADLKKLTAEYNDMPFRSVAQKVEEFKNSDKHIMFIHIREPENIQRAVDEFGAYTLLVKREGKSNIMSNYSDANVDNYNYDFIIENDTLENLEKRAKAFIEELKTSK